MKTSEPMIVVVLITATFVSGVIVCGDELTNQAVVATMPGLIDNLYLNGSGGGERPPGEHSTPFGSVGANWGIPLTPPDGTALGLQLGGSVKAREDDPELNLTFGGFARQFRTFQDQQGAAALLFDYRRTAFHNDVWAVRPILGTTISPQDALGMEVVAGLDREHGEEAIDEFVPFWTRDWSRQVATEFGLGYQFSSVDEALLRARLAYGFTPNADIGFGGDMNTDGDYALGVTVSYHFGGTGRHAMLDNIGGKGNELYTPFPDAGFPVLFHRSK